MSPANVSGMGTLAYILKVHVTLRRNMGPCLSPFNAFLFLQGLETLGLRQPRHSKKAPADIEQALKASHP